MYILNKEKACGELEQYVLNIVEDKAADFLKKYAKMLKTSFFVWNS